MALPVSYSAAVAEQENHLAAAIGNYLLQHDYSVLVVTVPDLMLRTRKCYDEGQSESDLLDDLCKVDLLVLMRLVFNVIRAMSGYYLIR